MTRWMPCLSFALGAGVVVVVGFALRMGQDEAGGALMREPHVEDATASQPESRYAVAKMTVVEFHAGIRIVPGSLVEMIKKMREAEIEIATALEASGGSKEFPTPQARDLKPVLIRQNQR
jgi:hypothetical protein